MSSETRRFVVLKASGSRYAYVNDTQEGRTVARYDIFKKYGKYDGWQGAEAHADRLESAIRQATEGKTP